MKKLIIITLLISCNSPRQIEKCISKVERYRNALAIKCDCPSIGVVIPLQQYYTAPMYLESLDTFLLSTPNAIYYDTLRVKTGGHSRNITLYNNGIPLPQKGTVFAK